MQDSFLILLFILGLSVFCVFFLLYFNDLIERRQFKTVFPLKIALLSLIFSYAIPQKSILMTQWTIFLFIFLTPMIFYFYPNMKKLFFDPKIKLHTFLVCNCPLLVLLTFTFFVNTNSYWIYSTCLISLSILLLCLHMLAICLGFIDRYFLFHDCLIFIWILLNFAILVGLENYVSYGKKIIKYLYQSLHIEPFGLFGMIIFFAIPFHIFFLIFLIRRFKKIKIFNTQSPSLKES